MYPGASQTTGATGPTNQAVTVGSWDNAQQTATFAINSDTNLPKGRYVVRTAQRSWRQQAWAEQPGNNFKQHACLTCVGSICLLLQVAVRPTNTKLDGATSSAVQGAYENSAMAAMGTPGQPSVTGLDNPLSGTTREKKSLQVT